MPYLNRHLLLLGALTGVLAACQPQDVTAPGAPKAHSAARTDASETRYVVLFKEDLPEIARLLPEDEEDYGKRVDVMRAFVSQRLGDQLADRAAQVYTFAAHGFAAPLTEEEREVLLASPLVASVLPDEVIALEEKLEDSQPVQPMSTQITPWGIRRVGGFVMMENPNRRAWVIDSGIDLEHPDLNVDVANGRSFVSYTTSFDDDNFHGTHVAGTIAAKNNSFGVVGVAAGAPVVPIKAFNSGGAGFTSDILAAVDYVAVRARPGDVVNCSFGGFGTRTYNSVILNASDRKALRFVLSAGNSNLNAALFSPAMLNGRYIYTISAIDIADRKAGFSNWGNPPIDFAAPGVSVSSTIPLNLFTQFGGYASTSGTSMAAPHVAGLLLSGTQIGTDGYMINDVDGSPDPIARRIRVPIK
ncbi:S8 family peptidase [Tellurirhabdus rosea]|uniref:S8 family peptidase n=1 Tax=Tellurirhabdus rosea TaxID=2674997 RepID=UPI002256FA7E|nr:S8 family serine peptidase [Tellurirhabdus rosea]